MEKTILRKEVLRLMDEGATFDMIYVTCDRKRGTGGELIEVKGWQKVNGTRATAERGAKGRFLPKQTVKNPAHILNKTVNIVSPQFPDRPKKVHWRLIQFFNGKRVVS